MTLKVKYFLLVVGLFIQSGSLAQLNKAYFFYQGQRLISQGKFKESIIYLNTLIETDSTIAEGWFLRGIAKYYLNDYQGSHSDFTKSIRHNPILAQAYHYRANVENQMEKYSDALKDLDIAREIRPNDPDIIFTRGITHFQMLNYSEAIEDFTRVIQRSSGNLEAWLNRGTSRLLMGDTLGSIEDYGYAIRLNPFNADSYTRRGRVYFDQKKINPALDDINKSIELDSLSTLNYFTRALIHNSNGNIRKAIEDFNRVLKLDPDNSLSLYNRAIIKSQIGDLNSSLADYDRLIKLNPGNVLVYYNRASVLFELNRFNEAINDYSRAIELFPDFANAYINRSVSKTKIGDMKGADADFRIANEKIQKYKASSQEAYVSMADTSEKFNKLLSLNADFSAGYSKLKLNDDLIIPTSFLPFYVLSVERNAFSNKAIIIEHPFINTLNELILKDYRFSMVRRNNQNYLNDSIIHSKPQTESINHFLSAIKFSDDRKYSLAVKEYEKALAVDADNPIIKNNLAVEKIEMARFIEQFDAEIGTISLISKSTPNKDDVKSKIFSYEEAISLFKNLENDFPSLEIIPYNIGNAYFLIENLESSIISYTRAINLNASFAEAWYNRGLAYLIKGEKQKGCFDISKAGELGINESYSIIQKFCK